MEMLIGFGVILIITWLIFRKRFHTHPGSKNWAYVVDERISELAQDCYKIERLEGQLLDYKTRIERMEMNVELLDVILKERSH